MKGEPITILLVEDDAGHAEIVKRNLAKSRLANKLVHVEDGEAGLDYLFHRGKYADKDRYPLPGLVLLDLRLPRVDGLEVLRTAKADPTVGRVPIVILTTSESEADLLGAYDRGANSYIVKPVSFEKFGDLLEALGYYWLVWNQNPY